MIAFFSFYNNELILPEDFFISTIYANIFSKYTENFVSNLGLGESDHLKFFKIQKLFFKSLILINILLRSCLTIFYESS